MNEIYNAWKDIHGDYFFTLYFFPFFENGNGGRTRV